MGWGPAKRDPGLGTNPVTFTVTSRHPKQGQGEVRYMRKHRYVTIYYYNILLTDGKLGGGLRSGMGGTS